MICFGEAKMSTPMAYYKAYRACRAKKTSPGAKLNSYKVIANTHELCDCKHALRSCPWSDARLHYLITCLTMKSSLVAWKAKGFLQTDHMCSEDSVPLTAAWP